MLKLKFISFLLLISSLNSFAQKLTEDEKTIFDEVVYKRKKVGDYETLVKWTKPIRYKIYGDTSEYLVKEVDSFFNTIRKLTSLDIKKATNSSEENYEVVFGKKPEDFIPYTLLNKPLNSPGSYRVKLTKGIEINFGQSLINTKKYGSRLNIKNAVKRTIIKTLGFSNNSKLAPRSVFTNLNHTIKLDDFDSHIISALYNPAIKPGMTKDEVDKINP